MKKTLLFALFLTILLITQAVAFDLGMELNNTVGTKSADDFGLYYDHKATLWVSAPFNNDGTSRLDIEGSILATKPILANEYSLVINLDLLRLSFQLANDSAKSITMDIGRIPVSDTSSLYLDSKADGVQFFGIFGFGNLELFAGYTGLLNVRSGALLMTNDDRAESVTEELYAFGSSRIIGKAAIQIPELLGSSDFIAEATGQFDLRTMLQDNYEQSIHTIFLTLGLNGPLGLKNLFYSLNTVIENGILEDEGTSYSVLSGIATARLDFFPGSINHVYTELLYSPPNNAIFSEFIPVTYKPAGTLYGNGYGNLFRISAGWNINPTRSFNLSTGLKVFINQEELIDNDGLYNATEVSLGATVSATSDLRFQLGTDLLFPNNDDMKYQVALKAILDL